MNLHCQPHLRDGPLGHPQSVPKTGSITISEKSPAYAEVVVTNTISRDLGDLRISRSSTAPLALPVIFTISYDCAMMVTHDGTVELGAGTTDNYWHPAWDDLRPLNLHCQLRQRGWTFGTSTFSPETGEVTVSELSSPAYAEVVVTNTISRNMGELKISKVFDPLTSLTASRLLQSPTRL